MINEEWSQVAANAICHAVESVKASLQNAAECMAEPSVLYRPQLYIDGDMWCALYGENLQDGVAGFGKSPALAMLDFNIKWHESLAAPVALTGLQRSDNK